MVKKYTVDKKIIQELTRAVKELTKALEKSNLNKNTYIKQDIDEPKRVKVHHPGALVSPMVGTVYLSPEPGKKTFVKKGQLVKQNDILMMIEAMKTFNTIKAPKSGKIINVLVNDAEPVEYGQPLIVIK